MRIRKRPLWQAEMQSLDNGKNIVVVTRGGSPILPSASLEREIKTMMSGHDFVLFEKEKSALLDAVWTADRMERLPT